MNPEEQERQRRKIQKQLDDALAESFPASDPVSIVTSQEEEDWGGDEGTAKADPGGGEAGGSGGSKRGAATGDAVKGR